MDGRGTMSALALVGAGALCFLEASTVCASAAPANNNPQRINAETSICTRPFTNRSPALLREYIRRFAGTTDECFHARTCSKHAAAGTSANLCRPQHLTGGLETSHSNNPQLRC